MARARSRSKGIAVSSCVDERKAVGKRLHQLRLARLIGALRIFERDQNAVGRAGERVRREHHDEVDGERLPIDLAEIGDARLDIAAEHVDGDGVADFQPKPWS